VILHFCDTPTMPQSIFGGRPVIIAVCVARDARTTLDSAERSIAAGADIVELNIAQLSDRQIDLLQLPTALPHYVVCRRRHFMKVYGIEPGSLADRNDQRRMELCLQMVQAGARALDMECDTFTRGENQIPKFLPPDLRELSDREDVVHAQQKVMEKGKQNGANIVLSCHTGLPLAKEQCIKLARLMAARGADAVKIVTAHTDPDYAEWIPSVILEMRRSVSIPFIFISMGPGSRILRAIGPYLGNAGVYCRAGSPSEFFPDHFPIQMLRDMWQLLPPQAKNESGAEI